MPDSSIWKSADQTSLFIQQIRSDIKHVSMNKESSAMLSALTQQTSQNSTYMGLIVAHIVGGGLGRSYCHEMWRKPSSTEAEVGIVTGLQIHMGHGYGLVRVWVWVGHSHPLKKPTPMAWVSQGFMGSQSASKEIFLGIYSLAQLLFTYVYIILYKVLLQ